MTRTKAMSDCHARNVRRWPLRAMVWYHWGIQGWRPAVVVGYTRCFVKLEYRDDKAWRTSRASANKLVARRRNGSPPPRGYTPPSCLKLAGAA